MKQLPVSIQQKLFVSLYLPYCDSDKPLVTTTYLKSPDFLTIHETDVTIELNIDPGIIARCASTHFILAKAAIREEFSKALAKLEEARAKFLALEN